jgi:hypothetical protein
MLAYNHEPKEIIVAFHGTDNPFTNDELIEYVLN